MWSNKLETTRTTILFLLVCITTLVGKVSGCQVDGVSNWWLDLSVLDTDRGVIFQGATTDISGIQLAEHSGDGLNSGPYFVATHENAIFTLSLHENFNRYEEDETSMSMSISVTFSCSTASTLNTVFIISVIDTNNNDPIYSAGDEISFTVTPPLPPGYLVTGCVGGIAIRDIDLTTQRIDFEIEENDYFEIAYDAASSTGAKNFVAVLRTTTYIRSLPEPVSLQISATDVDLTGDPPRTTYATLRIEADGEFELPDEPVFSQAFYMASYSDDHELSFEQPVYLTQGYDDDISFNLTGEFSSYFQKVRLGNQVSIEVTSPLPADVISQGPLLLVLTATREFTSGTSATIVVLMPEAVELEFEEAHYEGMIIEDTLSLSQIVLTQGYEDGYEVTISSEYASYFEATQQSNIITLTKQPLDDNVIEENSFLTLKLVATSSTSSATVIVLLEIIKNDTVTPLFEERIYTGTYDTDTGLDISAITLYQGYDETVSFYMQGDYLNYFSFSQNVNVITLQLASSLPQEVIRDEQQILLTIGASKPRTVGAHTTVSISLPRARELSFVEESYTGSVEENVLTLDSIVLSTGYADDVLFSLRGDHSSFFTVTNIQNIVTVSLTTPLTETVIQENNFLILNLAANGVNTLRAIAPIVLTILKQDAATPVFDRHIYHGNYQEQNGFEMENITLSQGYDSTVTFRLEGDHSQYFAISNTENNVMLTMQSNIPEEIIYSNKVLVFNVIASKPLTVGANTAVAITFPQALTEAAVMRFAQNNYVGSLDNDILTLANVVLETGYTTTTIFTLAGEQASYFNVSNDGNIVRVTANSALPVDLIQSLQFIVIEIEAQRERAVAAYTSIIINISPEAISTPVFDEAYYRGVYTEESGLQFERTIYLQQGYDDTVTFALEGEFSEWFSLALSGEGLNLTLASEIPQVVVESYRQLLFAVVANKPGTTAARTVVSIDLPDEASVEVLRFARPSYVGRIDNGVLQVETVLILGENTDNLNFSITGEYSSYFTLNQDGNSVTIQLTDDLSTEAITSGAFLVLDLQVSRAGSTDGFTTIVLEIVRPDQLTPVFDSTFYTGSYSVDSGFSFNYTMQLIQGYDDTVEFTIEGDDAEWFSVTQISNSLILSIIDEGLSLVTDRSHLVFAVVANKPATLSGSAAVVVSLTDRSATEILRFSNHYYSGSIVNGSLSLDVINLAEGYSQDVNFAITGDLAEFFEVTNEESAVSLQLLSELPENLSESVVILTLEARSPTAVVYSAIVLEITRSIDTELTVPVFEEPYYLGSYAEIDGLSFDQQLRLIDGFDSSVVFSLEGEQSAWFRLQENDDSLTLLLDTTIAPNILENNRNLIFSAVARKGNLEGRTAIVISLSEDSVSQTLLRFEKSYYLGQLQNDTINLEPIIVSEGFNDNTTLTLRGDLAAYFQLTNLAATITLELSAPLPEDVLGVTRTLLLELEASAPQAISAYTMIVLDNSADDVLTPLVFTEAYYTGAYSEQGLMFNSSITLSNGNSGAVTYALEGEHSEWFLLEQVGNVATISLSTPIPQDVLFNNYNLIFTVTANQLGYSAARATIIISLAEAESSAVLRFEEIHYRGSIENNELVLNTITLTAGYSEDVTFALYGDLSPYFNLTVGGSIVTLVMPTPIDDNVLNINSLIILELEASSPDSSTISAYTTIILETYSHQQETVTLRFDSIHYVGAVSNGTSTLDTIIITEGYTENLTLVLEGEFSFLFSILRDGPNIRVSLQTGLPEESIPQNRLIVLELQASVPQAASAYATLIFEVTSNNDEAITSSLSFSEVYYTGSYTEEDGLSFEAIVSLSEGYEESVTFGLVGDYNEYFELTQENNGVTLSLATPLTVEILANNQKLLLVITAQKPGSNVARSTIVISLTYDPTALVVLRFERASYQGTIENYTITTLDTIQLTQGFDDSVDFALQGELEEFFTLSSEGATVTITLNEPISEQSISQNRIIILELQASGPQAITAYTTIVMEIITEDTTSSSEASFGKALYSGIVQSGEVNHETITVSGYNGTQVQILGANSNLFEASLNGGTVLVQAANTLIFPEDLTHVALELRAGDATTALVLDVYQTELPTVPTVTFSAASYEIRTDVSQTGLVGSVLATADNGERIVYTLHTDNAHLLERLSVSESGDLLLFAPVNSGVYAFSVGASTVATQVSASAPVRLIVDAITTCGIDQDLVVPPLIVLDRDEEEAHSDLIISNATGCRFTLTNRWPLDQGWLYVDEIGLHTREIDREDPSIAFMALSQVQVELILECDSDDAATARSKRSAEGRLDSLGPYDYGNNKWLIADTILYNSRRSFVNLIVNDINDNYPIFVGKENEPIAVGYPVPDLLDVVPPRALVELTATDADVGENADLVYWSSEPELAVSPTTGSVHIRDNERELLEGRRLTVHATDRKGEGLTGDIELVVRLLDVEHISVLTIRDAFLEEEQSILNNLTQAIGYDVKAITSTVVSDEYEVASSRIKRQTVQAPGASLRMYVYGLRNSVPVDVNELASDINSNVIASVVIADTISLQDYLESREICVIPGRDIGLLVATIVLSILLFILIVLIALWFVLKWRKGRNYEEFSDENSLASRNDSINVISKPDTVTRPRLNIEELKRSERRLQEMLDTPVKDVVIEASPSRSGLAESAILGVSLPDSNAPIVIQSIDKLKAAADDDEEDEFGERINNVRKKSVVTFNENVEKIIHVEDRPDSESEPEYEIEKL